jgi:hypothetical protein
VGLEDLSQFNASNTCARLKQDMIVETGITCARLKQDMIVETGIKPYLNDEEIREYLQ